MLQVLVPAHPRLAAALLGAVVGASVSRASENTKRLEA